jgi:hypothetical protein
MKSLSDVIWSDEQSLKATERQGLQYMGVEKRRIVKDLVSLCSAGVRNWPYIALAGVGLAASSAHALNDWPRVTSEDPHATHSPCAERSGSGLTLALMLKIACNAFCLCRFRQLYSMSDARM